MQIGVSRAVVAAILAGGLEEVETSVDPVFGLEVPRACPGVPTELLSPRRTWADPVADDIKAREVAALFQKNFATYAAGLGLPFFLSALAINSFLQFSRQLSRYIQAIHVVGGVLLIIVGFLLITDYMTLLNAYVLRFTPQWLLQRL